MPSPLDSVSARRPPSTWETKVGVSPFWKGSMTLPYHMKASAFRIEPQTSIVNHYGYIAVENHLLESNSPFTFVSSCSWPAEPYRVATHDNKLGKV